MIYLVETDNMKRPPVWTLGGRLCEYIDGVQDLQHKNVSGIFAFEGEVTRRKGTQINGHINRNTRMLIGLMQATKPVIELLGFALGATSTYDGTTVLPVNEIALYWRVVGCVSMVNGFGYKLSEQEMYKYN